jgi:hypothetical protein
MNPVGAAETAGAGTEIVIVVMLGLPGGLLIVITLEAAVGPVWTPAIIG